MIAVWKNPRKTLSQNFLVSGQVVDKIMETAGAGGRRVTELGAGTGAITKALLAAGFYVRAIEKDERLLDWAGEINKPGLARLKIINEDLKQADWTWDNAYQIIGNIPYQLSGLIIRRLVQLEPKPGQAILLVQREVGERLLARPPAGQLIGLAVQLWGRAERLMKVPPHAFAPAPKVASSLMLLTPHQAEILPARERERVLQIAAVFFRGRRKQMGGVLKRWRGLSAEETDKILKSAGIDFKMRPQEVGVEEWVRLTEVVDPYPPPKARLASGG